MSTNYAEPNKTDETVTTIFAGPVRRAVAVLLVMGPLLQSVEFLLGNDVDDNAARVAFWSAFPDRTGLAIASGLLAVPFLLGGIAVIVALTWSHSRHLAWVAGAFMVSAMVGLAAAHGYELAAFGLTLSGDPASAMSVLNAENLGLPGIILFILFIGGAVLGTLFLAVAMWRSPYVPRVVVLFILAFAVLDFAAGQGVISHLVNLAGFIILAVAVLRGYSRSLHQVTASAASSG